MTILEINKNHIFVQTTDVKGAQLGGHFVASKNAWRLPHNAGAVRDLIKQGYPLESHLEKLEKALRNMIFDKQFMANPQHYLLRDYQNQDVNFLMGEPQYGVFNEQRTGKTPTICTLIGKKAVKTLIVVPTSLVLDWQLQVEKWAMMPCVTVSSKLTKAKRISVYRKFMESDSSQVLVASKGIAKNDVEDLQHIGYEMIIIDESHFLRNYRTAQSEAMYKLGKRANYRYALTGTPASNSPDDVFGILKFLRPERFTSYWQFCERYFKVEDGFFGKKVDGTFRSESRELEYQELMEQYAIQRKRKDVMKWLAGKQYKKVVLEMGTKQANHYKRFKETFVTDKADGTELDASTVLAQMTRLRQLTLAPESVGVDAPSAKEDFVLEWLEDNKGEPVLIFSNFTSYITLLHDKLKKKKYKVGLITGEQTMKQRQAAKDKFQNGKLDILLCNIEAAGVGLTLDRAETSIFLDRHYNPTWNAQAEDRLVATTEDAPQGAYIIDLVCKDTFDEAILAMVEKKVDITKIVNNFSELRDLLGG